MEMDPVAEASEPTAGDRQSVAVAVEPEESHIRPCVQDGGRVTGPAEGGVDHESRRDRLEERDDLGKHDGDVAEVIAGFSINTVVINTVVIALLSIAHRGNPSNASMRASKSSPAGMGAVSGEWMAR